MWNPDGAQAVLWLHVLAACVWIGGQITIVALLPVLRGEPLLVSAVARRYHWVAWVSFAVLVFTGIANAHNAGINLGHLNGTTAGRTLELKLLFVLLSGAAAALHAFVVAPRASASRTPLTVALSGFLGSGALVFAMVAALYGVVIAQH